MSGKISSIWFASASCGRRIRHTTGSFAPLRWFPGENREDGIVSISGGATGLGAPNLEPYNVVQNKFTESDDVYWTHGSHNMKFSMSIQRVQTAQDNPFVQGAQFSFNSLLNFLLGRPLQVVGPLPHQADSYRTLREILLTPYFSDDWKVTSRLTLNLGLRWEFDTNPASALPNLEVIDNPPFGTGFKYVDHVWKNNPAWKNYSPRVGFAYDLFASHKTSLRGGFGVFHNVIAPRSYMPGFNTGPPYASAQQANPIFPTPFTGPVTVALTEGQGNYYPNTSTPYMMQWNLNVQREIVTNTFSRLDLLGLAECICSPSAIKMLPSPSTMPAVWRTSPMRRGYRMRA